MKRNVIAPLLCGILFLPAPAVGYDSVLPPLSTAICESIRQATPLIAKDKPAKSRNGKKIIFLSDESGMSAMRNLLGSMSGIRSNKQNRRLVY